MRVKAKYWLKYANQWHKTGEVFEIRTSDADELNGMVESMGTFAVHSEAGTEETEQPKRGRKKKTETEAE